MLSYWLHPLVLEDIINEQALGTWQFAKNILLYIEEFPPLQQVQVAIIGIGGHADAIRRQLYSLSYAFEDLRIADLGNVRDDEPEALAHVLAGLLEAHILPIILAEDMTTVLPQHLQILGEPHTQKLRLCIIDAYLRLHWQERKDTPSLYTLLKNPRLGHLSAIGTQAHLIDKRLLQYLEDKHYEVVRLGKLRHAFEEAEPLLRDAHLIAFHIQSLRAAEVNGHRGCMPSGLQAEEACQLLRYAGMSEKLFAVGFYGLTSSDEQATLCMAQGVWYFLEGMQQRKGDYPVSAQHLVEYLVDSKDMEEHFKFWKSKKSNRWWVQIALPHQRHAQAYSRLIPCSYTDYQQASAGELTERMTAILQQLV